MSQVKGGWLIAAHRRWDHLQHRCRCDIRDWPCEFRSAVLTQVGGRNAPLFFFTTNRRHGVITISSSLANKHEFFSAIWGSICPSPPGTVWPTICGILRAPGKPTTCSLKSAFSSLVEYNCGFNHRSILHCIKACLPFLQLERLVNNSINVNPLSICSMYSPLVNQYCKGSWTLTKIIDSSRKFIGLTK